MNYERLTRSYLDGQIERVERLRNTIAAEANILAPGRVIPNDGDLAIGTGRRLSAAVLFLDICNFSSRPAETDVEQGNLLRLLSFFFSEVIKIVEDYGGVVEKNTGDGLMAYFSDEPGSVVPAQQIALSAALTIFATVNWLINPVILNSSLPKIDFRICIDHGFVTIADVGAAKRFRGIVAIGTTANVACKMLKFAEANQILIGDQMLVGLPQAWREKYVRLKSSETGWVYRQTGAPYHFWEYTGRWQLPTS